jgi:PAS domain S-box-containing protein
MAYSYAGHMGLKSHKEFWTGAGSAPATHPSSAESRLWYSVVELEERIQQLQEANETKARILEILGRATAEDHLDGICRCIVESTRELLVIDRAGLFLWDADARCFRGTYGTALDGQTTDEHHLVAGCRPGEGWTRIAEGAAIVRKCKLGQPEERAGEAKIKADLVAFRIGDRLYGALSVDNRISRRPIPDEALRHLSLLSRVLGNVVELTRARAALSRREEHFAQIARHTREWIWESDLAGRYRYCNPTVDMVLGVPPPQLIGRPLTDFVARWDRDRVDQVLARFRQGGRDPARLSIRHVHRDGREVITETVCFPSVSESGALEGFWGSHRDISLESEAERQSRNLQNMEAIGQLAGGLAHEFNNRLTSILGAIDLLKSRPGGEPDRECLGVIEEAAQGAARLTQQLLAFSGRQVMRWRRVNANQLIRELEPTLRRLLGPEVKFQMKLADDLPDLETDPDHLRQALLDLVRHARDAAAGASPYDQPDLWSAADKRSAERRLQQVTLETARVSPDADAQARARHPDWAAGPHLAIRIADTGPGLPRHVTDHLFEPFFTTRSSGFGAGLGLSTVYGIVKQMRGQIEVHSAPGRGSQIHVYLPETGGFAGGGPADSTATAATAGGGGECVLVVDDEPEIRRLMERMLQSLGYRVLAAGDGRDGLAVWEANRADIQLVVTDMVMPHLGGKELVEAIRKRGSSVKAVFVSGYSRHEMVDGQRLGTEAPLLQKPFSREELAGLVRRMLDGAPARA